jgi:outer membrane protein assembly factor BamE (lipoprotein component of BamABCDE complex)
LLLSSLVIAVWPGLSTSDAPVPNRSDIVPGETIDEVAVDE